MVTEITQNKKPQSALKKEHIKTFTFSHKKTRFSILSTSPLSTVDANPTALVKNQPTWGQQTPQAIRTPQNVATTVAVEPGKPKMILGGVISSRVVGSTPYPKDASPANKGLKGGRSRFPQKSGDVILKKMSS